MFGFKDFYNERVSINSEWLTVQLPSGAEINVSIKLLSKGKLQVSKADEKYAKEIAITSDIIQSIEKEIGEKIDTKNPDIIKLLKTIGDCKLK